MKIRAECSGRHQEIALAKVVRGLSRLLQSHGGLFSAAAFHEAASDEPQVTTCIVNSGDVGRLWPNIRAGHQRDRRSPIQGAGTGLDMAAATVPALGEGLERYSTSIYDENHLLTATAQELGGDALDLDSIPRCSYTELSHAKCPLSAPDKRTPIQWVQGISLMDGRAVYLPAVMVYLFIGAPERGARFWLPISTGCAAHESYESALLSAIFEVAERDAISLVWLQKLTLPHIQIDSVPSSLAPFWERYQRSSADLEYLFFDATTDLGIPTVYALQIAHRDPRLRTLVSCSTGTSPEEAVAKAIRDMASCRIAFRNHRSIPENWDDFTDLFHGATYMAHAERAHAFDFLMAGDKVDLSRIPSLDSEGGNEKAFLCQILQRFREKKLDVYAIDLSTDEAVRSGIRVVRVVIPGLQPLSFRYRAQYLGHPRLYQAPKLMGHPVLKEDELNRWPQPFA